MPWSQEADIHCPEGLEFQGYLFRSMCPLLKPQVGPEQRNCPGDARRSCRGAREEGDRVNQEDVPQSSCIRAKKRSGVIKGSGQLSSISPGARPQAGDTEMTLYEHSWGFVV